jgi:transcriptional regulator with XRE-family HTH domain
LKRALKCTTLILIQQLKYRREQLGVAQEQLSELADVALRTVKELDSGKGNPTVSTLIKLADVLGMELKLEVKKPRNFKMRKAKVYRNACPKILLFIVGLYRTR